ncbi:alpha/beta hydrolase [Lachnospiraceae bacterium MD1]|jgi:pimeloyl-ACP methyl ester carboxylesterase|uniref:Alpha/beta hydrolase n=1 Tax=Variimorphobacter saccharofermentans TaxID=2755051 RepID=A0A839JZZ7_9FIRM|nr:alpha/beta hydrolase [Variimorphobacter saccharofermentans]MBB2183253.1 alpha/beta hydrolase [Variimorphobacter saccharofermentans]
MICRVNSINLYYEMSGVGKPLILLHGNGETHKIFDKAIPILSEHFTVYAIDSRGHGQSDSVLEYHYDDMAEDIKCFIHELKLEQPILYGFSDGGIIGLILASKYPQLLSRLIISGANTVPDGIRTGWLRLFQCINAVVKEPKMTMMLKEPNITTEMLKCIVIPTTVLAGSRDMVKRSHTEYIADSIPNSKLNILQGEGHGSYVLHNTKLVNLILDATK